MHHCWNDRYGPKPSPPSAPFNAKARLNVEVKFAPFASGTRRFVPGKVSRRCSVYVRSAVADKAVHSKQDTEAPALSLTLYQSLLPSLILDSLPKSQIDLFVTILESDGSDSDISAWALRQLCIAGSSAATRLIYFCSIFLCGPQWSDSSICSAC